MDEKILLSSIVTELQKLNDISLVTHGIDFFVIALADLFAVVLAYVFIEKRIEREKENKAAKEEKRRIERDKILNIALEMDRLNYDISELLLEKDLDTFPIDEVLERIRTIFHLSINTSIENLNSALQNDYHNLQNIEFQHRGSISYHFNLFPMELRRIKRTLYLRSSDIRLHFLK